MAYRELMPKAYLDSLDVVERASRWRKSLAEAHKTMTALAVDDQDVAMGFCLYGLPRDADVRGTRTGEVIALNVIPSSWRSGYGAALLDAAMIDARRIGWQKLILWVLADNRGARAFYERYGYALDGAQKSDTQTTGTALLQVRYAIDVRDQ
jgi:GNAT superfamily N-acetyltransferase